MTTYRYILEKSSKKHLCPRCNQKRMVRYIDIETKQYLPEHYGKCERIENCTYYCNPYKDGYHKTQMANNGNKWHNNNTDYKTTNTAQNRPSQKPSVPIPEKVLFHTLKNYDTNNFIQYLCTKFVPDEVVKQIENYFVGTVKNYTSFPFIDSLGVCRTISLIDYDTNGKRNKNEIHQFRNIHTYLQTQYKKQNELLPNWLNQYLQNENKFTCLFGEHLINTFENKYKPIAVAEAPKTAFIASIVYPMYVWVAVGALNYLNEVRIKAIQSRDVYLFPDTSTNSIAYNLWQNKAKQYGFNCVDLLEQLATNTEKKDGYDLADYILEYDFTNANLGTNGNKWETNESELNRSEVNLNNIALVAIDGTLYIPTPPLFKTFTRYTNGITAYNNRTQIPDFVADIPLQTNEVFINLKTLTI